MVIAVLLARLDRGARLCDEVDVVLQPRPSKHGLGRIHSKTAAGHGCVTFLLLRPLQKGRITDIDDGLMSEEEVREVLYEFEQADSWGKENLSVIQDFFPELTWADLNTQDY